jgi:putative SOS response-associated peptidase YedK
MCGRYIVVTKIKEIEKKFGVTMPKGFSFGPSANVAPGTLGLVITNEQPKALSLFRFGFTPSWSKDGKLVINARAEGVHNPDNRKDFRGAKGIIDKPMFRKAIRTQRCLVIADGFIEGPDGKGLSEPYCVYPRQPQGPMALGGIWDRWQKGEETVDTFAIVTTAGNAVLDKVGHHRCPLILDEQDQQTWLDSRSSLSEITSLLYPCSDQLLNAYPISAAIKSPHAQGSELLRPIGERVVQEYNYEVYQDVEMFGMGETRARKRREDDSQMSLF